MKPRRLSKRAHFLVSIAGIGVLAAALSAAAASRYQDSSYLQKHGAAYAYGAESAPGGSAGTAVKLQAGYEDRDYLTRHGSGEAARGIGATGSGSGGAGFSDADSKGAGTTSGGGVGALLTENAPVGLLALGLAGFTLWQSRRPGAPVTAVTPSTAPASEGKTGVARYVDRVVATQAGKAAPAETSVARYLKNRA